MNPFTITVENLSKRYPGRSGFWPALGGRPDSKIDALIQVNLEVRNGEILGLLGPNGAGKTTLLEILSTLLLPDSGRALVCGCDVVQEAAKVRGLVGYCPAGNPGFYPRLDGTANLEFFALLQNCHPREARKKITAVFDWVEINGAGRKPFQKYSDGMKQRLSLARALLGDPQVLLLDEPTRSLDPLLQTDLWRFFRETLAGKLGKTILLVTHSLAEAEAVCDRVAILNRGKITGVGSSDEIRQSFGGGTLAGTFHQTPGEMD